MSTPLVSAAESPFPYQHQSIAEFEIGDLTTNAVTVSVTLKKQNREALTSPSHVGWHISGDADGISIVSAALSGGVAAGDNGTVFSHTAGKVGFAVSEDDGTIDFVLTDTGDVEVYLALRMPDGSLAVSGLISFDEGTGS